MTTWRQHMTEWTKGSFRPNLMPTSESLDELRVLQTALHDEVIETSPNAQSVEDIHASIFYMRPDVLLKYMKERVSPRVTPESLFEPMMHHVTILLMLLHKDPPEVRTMGLARFGQDDSIIGLALHSDDFEDATLDIKTDIHYALRDVGVTRSIRDDMAQDPRFMWLMRRSIPHISLQTNTNPHEPIPDIAVPDVINFDAIDVGGATYQPDDPNQRLWWQLRGIATDQSEYGKALRGETELYPER